MNYRTITLCGAALVALATTVGARSPSPLVGIAGVYSDPVEMVRGQAEIRAYAVAPGTIILGDDAVVAANVSGDDVLVLTALAQGVTNVIVLDPAGVAVLQTGACRRQPIGEAQAPVVGQRAGQLEVEVLVLAGRDLADRRVEQALPDTPPFEHRVRVHHGFDRAVHFVRPPPTTSPSWRARPVPS